MNGESDKNKLVKLLKLLTLDCNLILANESEQIINGIKSKYHRLLSLREDVDQSIENLRERKSDLRKEQLKTNSLLVLKRMLNDGVLNNKSVLAKLMESIEDETDEKELQRKLNYLNELSERYNKQNIMF